MYRYTRHNEVLILDSKPGDVEARYFNIVHTAMKRISKHWRTRIPGLNHLDLILQDDAWIIVDRVLNDMPVAAWTNFETGGRDNLNEPIPCEIRIYHFAARAVLQTTLDKMEQIVRDSLKEHQGDEEDNIIEFNERES